MAKTSYGQQEPEWPKMNEAQENRKEDEIQKKKSKNGDSYLLTQK